MVKNGFKIMHIVYRGYYTAVRRYYFYFRVVKTIVYERAQRVSKILCLTREDKSHIFKPPCNVLFIIQGVSKKLNRYEFALNFAKQLLVSSF
jgi:hypothetical protein